MNIFEYLDQHSLISVFLIIPIAGALAVFVLMMLEHFINNMISLIKVINRHITLRKIGWPPHANMDGDGDIIETPEEGEEEEAEQDAHNNR